MNPEQSIIVIDDNIKLVQNKHINNVISSELLRNHNFLTWVMFKLDFYDSEHDEIKCWEALKVIFNSRVWGSFLNWDLISYMFNLRSSSCIIQSCLYLASSSKNGFTFIAAIKYLPKHGTLIIKPNFSRLKVKDARLNNDHKSLGTRSAIKCWT